MKPFFGILLLFLMTSTILDAQVQFKPPVTKPVPVVDELHGFQLTDNYQWLEDKTKPEVIDWTRAQHDHTLNYLEATSAKVEGLKEEIAAYIDRDITGPIFLEGDRQFFYVKKKGEQQYKLYTRLDEKDVLVFDPTSIDDSGMSAISGVNFTQKGDKVAVGVQYKGAEISAYRVVDTKTGDILGDPIEGLRGYTWTKDEKHAYITVGTKEMLEQQIPLKTYLHKIGSDRKEDVFLGAPSDAKNFMSVYDSRYSDLTFISEGDFYSNTLSMKTVGSDDEAKTIYSSKKFRTSPYAVDDKIYFMTNHEAPNFKLMVADKNNADFENWKELIPEQETVLESYIITKDYLIVQDKKDVVSRLSAYDHEGKFIKEIELPEIGNVGGISFHKESNTAYVNLSTFTAPTKIYTLDGSSLEWKLYFEREVPLDTKDIEASIKFYNSKDGTRVPIFVMHKKGVKLDGSNPALLYGYGGFNIGMSPNFIGLSATFVNRGGVYAIACIRGGDEYGEKWHEDGMLKKKQNSFDDFIAAAEYLINEGYTNNERLACRGGSNGGLLIGAVINQRPDLFKAAICAVPLLDMIRYHKFLIARYWIPEYGDPEVKEDFQNILTYSPYHNIRMGINVPTTMVIAGENDTRVDPLHAKKFVAALQNNPGQINPVMLYMDYDSGHGSGKSTEKQIEDLEAQYGFIMNQLGMK
ncbi:MAG: prolyl oligopeptidase [Saprospiraceae bacterium]|jgi:prolyl oligopeptidase